MGIYCLTCRNKVNVDHHVFYDYAGPVKCFVCGGIMQARITRGVVTYLKSGGRTAMLPAPTTEQVRTLLPAPGLNA